MKRNRRTFLKTCCSLGAAGMASQLGRLGLVSAYAPPADDYKALVCIFLFGGNDSNNMIVPIDSRYSAYQTMRGNVALAGAELLPAGGTGYGLHPNLVGVQRLFNEQRAALVFNVGTLVRPTTRETLDAAMLPKNLYSHADQVQQWQTSDPNGGGTGWGGRLGDLAAALQAGARLPPGITVNGGNSLFLSGPLTSGVSVATTGSPGLDEFGDAAAMAARLGSIQKLLTFDSGLKLVSAANGVLADAIKSTREIEGALGSAPVLPVAFPASPLGQQLAQVAQIMAVRDALGMSRQIFFAGMGGFDNHEQLLGNHAQLMRAVDAAIGAFMATMEARGTSSNVTLFTESEFNRTANANANNGTDHAWGGHHMVIGGAVQGGTYGIFPKHELRGPDDAADRGKWIPTTSLDQYAATLGGWFGVSDADLMTVFPNLANFAPQRLGFV